MPTVPRVCVLVSDRDDLSLLPDLVDAGVDGFQVRAKDLDDLTLWRLVLQVQDRVAGRATVIVNDRADVALAAGADGVHLGRADLPVSAVRRLVDGSRPGVLVGATCRTAAHVATAREEGADYAGFGPVWATTSKEGLPPPRGLDELAAATGTLPLLAIGGVGPGHAGEAVRAGAHGVAVIGAVWQSADPVAAAGELVARVGQVEQVRP